MFIRFITREKDPTAPGPLGIFQAAGRLRTQKGIDEWTAARLDEILDWFNANLPAPTLDSRFWRAAFWFRSDRQGMISRLWELVAILEDHGVQVQLVRAKFESSFVIVYRDEYQIAAMPMKQKTQHE